MALGRKTCMVVGNQELIRLQKIAIASCRAGQGRIGHSRFGQGRVKQGRAVHL